MTTLIYHFEELPLITRDGWKIALVSGEAEIICFRDGTWSVAEISLDGFKEGKSEAHALGQIVGTFEYGLYMLIWNALTNGPAKVFIQDKVDAALEDARASFADDLGDYVRKLRCG